MFGLGTPEIILILIVISIPILIVYFTLKKNNKIEANPNKGINWGMGIICFFIPLVGIILYFIDKQKFPKKANQELTISVISFVLGLILKSI
jgi:membrane protease YdiL (CAAX protease family)